MRIGLVGKGFIGEAFYEGMKDHYTIDVWDTDPNKCTVASLRDLVGWCDVIFVSVPTPMRKNGSCDTSIVERVVTDINRVATTQKIVVVRSTVPPGTCERLDKSPYGVSVVFNPEFLTEAKHIEDFKNQDRIVLGGRTDAVRIVETVYGKAFPGVPVVLTDWQTAEMVKYVANTFLSTKVAFANEIKSVCDELGIDYDRVIKIATLDKRLGTSHWKVPGPDGHRGFGGTCVKPDTTIFTPNGQTQIQYLTVGERVYSTNERIDAVNTKNITSVHSRDYEGDLYEFNLPTGKFTCTPDHLIPIVRDGVNLLLPAKDVRLTDMVYIYTNK
jgi:UDPglucose 6-dehydrogenase